MEDALDDFTGQDPEDAKSQDPEGKKSSEDFKMPDPMAVAGELVP